jgi:hypothetical protein
MSKKIAILDSNSTVINVILVEDNFEETASQIGFSDSNPAFIGGDYVDGFFYPPKPFESWTRGQGQWVAPKPYPTDGFTYLWNEAESDWQLVDFSEPTE